MRTIALRPVSPRLAWLAVGAIGLGAWVVLAIWTPPHDPHATLCFFRQVTGIPCAGCGLTRALALLAKGEWSAAVAIHPLAPVLALEAAAGWLLWLAVIERWIKAPSMSLVNGGLIANAVVLLVVWALRLASGTLPG
ncbi:MAG TPA: DUF2752 domain-containing protein [Candidatus Eisenbacteria bacterium]|jgi:hypothetical protein